MIIHCSKLLNVQVTTVENVHNFFSPKLGADGAPEEYPVLCINQIIVRMHDNSTYQGFITEIKAHDIPKWMQPHQTTHRLPYYYVYIKMVNNQHFIVYAPLAPLKTSPYHNPLLHLPLLAEIRIGQYRHLTAKYFTFFDVNNPPNHQSLESHVFVATPGGPVVSANMQERALPLQKRKRRVNINLEDVSEKRKKSVLQ